MWGKIEKMKNLRNFKVNLEQNLALFFIYIVTEIEIIKKNGKDRGYSTKIIETTEVEENKFDNRFERQNLNSNMSGASTNPAISQQPIQYGYDQQYQLPMYAYGLYDNYPQVMAPLNSEAQIQDMLRNQASMGKQLIF